MQDKFSSLKDIKEEMIQLLVLDWSTGGYSFTLPGLLKLRVGLLGELEDLLAECNTTEVFLCRL